MNAVFLQLPNDIAQRLQHLTHLTGRSKKFFMLEAIREHLDDLEELYISEQRLIANRAGQSASIPLEDVMSRYGMKD